MATVPSPSPSNTFSFTLAIPSDSSSARFGPRLGKARLVRADGSPDLAIDTPGFLTTTSRGVIPHLSRDHHKQTEAIRWVNIPFETFLEQVPPVPTLQGGPHPLHTFLGYPPTHNALVMSVRDPACAKELPPNGKTHISAHSLRGVRKVSTDAWRAYVSACNPDLVVALSDTPYTPPPHSQKRLTKSLERSTAWLADLLRPFAPPSTSTDVLDLTSSAHPLNVLVHMAGGPSLAARAAFAEGLVETLYGPEADCVKPLKTLDEGVVGYVFDLVPLRLALAPVTVPSASASLGLTDELTPLLQSSLTPLPSAKLRLVNSAASPHEMLRLVRDVGVDVFDAAWAQEAAAVGIALDFVFSVPLSSAIPAGDLGVVTPEANRDLGHNLYDEKYANDFSPLADSFLAGINSIASTSNSKASRSVCPCAACSPLAPSIHISHSSLDAFSFPPPSTSATSVIPTPEYLPPFTRAYIHHLLHTHEMSAHALLAMHNLSILDAFFAGVRSVITSEDTTRFGEEVDRFMQQYDEGMGVFEMAKGRWKDVDIARGKGRMAREKAKDGLVLEATPVGMIPTGETTLPSDTIIDLES